MHHPRLTSYQSETQRQESYHARLHSLSPHPRRLKRPPQPKPYPQRYVADGNCHRCQMGPSPAAAAAPQLDLVPNTKATPPELWRKVYPPPLPSAVLPPTPCREHNSGRYADTVSYQLVQYTILMTMHNTCTCVISGRRATILVGRYHTSRMSRHDAISRYRKVYGAPEPVAHSWPSLSHTTVTDAHAMVIDDANRWTSCRAFGHLQRVT